MSTDHISVEEWNIYLKSFFVRSFPTQREVQAIKRIEAFLRIEAVFKNMRIKDRVRSRR